MQRKKLSRSNFNLSHGKRLSTQLEMPLDAPQVHSQAKKKKGLNTFNIIMILIITAIIIVVYINNVISVDRLLIETTALQEREADLKMQGEQIRASINLLSSYTRIREIAVSRLNMEHNRQQPTSLDVYIPSASENK